MDPLTFQKNVMTELTVYDSVWQYFSTPSNKRLTERDKCEWLLKHVAKEDLTFAIQQQGELQKKGSTYTLEKLLRALEEQHRLVESLPQPRAEREVVQIQPTRKYSRQQILQSNNSKSVRYAEVSTMFRSVQRRLTG